MIEWTYFPQSDHPNVLATRVVEAFETQADAIDSPTHEGQSSDEVLAKLADGLTALGFRVERGKRAVDKIKVPVLFGRNGHIDKSFEADACHEDVGFVLEVEAGRGVANYQFLKDLFQACMMQKAHYLAIAVRRLYRSSQDYEGVFTFFDTLYKSNRLSLPLRGILIMGY